MQQRIKVLEIIQIKIQHKILPTNLKRCMVYLKILLLQDLKAKMNFIQMKIKALTAPIKMKAKMFQNLINLICSEIQLFRRKKSKNKPRHILKQLQIMQILVSKLTSLSDFKKKVLTMSMTLRRNWPSLIHRWKKHHDLIRNNKKKLPK